MTSTARVVDDDNANADARVIKTINANESQVADQLKSQTTRDRRRKKTLKTCNPVIIENVSKYLEMTGTHKCSLPKLKHYLSTVLPQEITVPCTRTLSLILRGHFSLRYIKSKPANARYFDPKFNEKRLWVSRLLATFMERDALIISVDESNLRANTLNGFNWEFVPKVKDRSYQL